ncbi:MULTISPECIES: hypothetical protein [unclassified Nocardioides]|jgi:hypothetical protein|uniref:hypothetical protein n=1 Tax=unclassified Nocardioides TaxID=2615069 RepID=UPI000702EEFE|nr:MULTISPECIES: hypothetical protein [unclassified Nocardioides]KRC52683.1 hypothetical protein ASE19_09630 [Nocardioides sp. Root79]KRC72215.1 hypothetical protein ASE20_06165 [Nocardioides sp. Root240]
MSIELTSAALLALVAFFCAAWVARSHDVVEVLPLAANVPSTDEWRSAALRHFHEHKDLQRSVAEALSTPGAVTGEARRELMVALGAPRVDVFA